MNYPRMRNLVASAAAIAAMATGTSLSATAAHADAVQPPMCVYVATPGASGDISAIKCQHPDKTFDTAMWSWGSADLSLTSASRGDLGRLDITLAPDPSDPMGIFTDIWRFDATNVSFSDFRKELVRAWGYTNVYFDGYAASGEGVIRANFEKPSKAKH